MWSEEQGEVFRVAPPSADEREAYFRPLLLDHAVAPPPAPAASAATSSPANTGQCRCPTRFEGTAAGP